MQTSTSGGDADTEVNEFMVIPTGSSAWFRTVATATPVANFPHAFRKLTSSIGDSCAGIDLDNGLSLILS